MYFVLRLGRLIGVGVFCSAKVHTRLNRVRSLTIAVRVLGWAGSHRYHPLCMMLE